MPAEQGAGGPHKHKAAGAGGQPASHDWADWTVSTGWDGKRQPTEPFYAGMTTAI